jgi:hypothetical protein
VYSLCCILCATVSHHSAYISCGQLGESWSSGPLDRPIRSSKVLNLDKIEILETPRMNISMTHPYSSTDCSTK